MELVTVVSRLVLVAGMACLASADVVYFIGLLLWYEGAGFKVARLILLVLIKRFQRATNLRYDSSLGLLYLRATSCSGPFI